MCVCVTELGKAYTRITEDYILNEFNFSNLVWQRYSVYDEKFIYLLFPSSVSLEIINFQQSRLLAAWRSGRWPLVRQRPHQHVNTTLNAAISPPMIARLTCPAHL